MTDEVRLFDGETFLEVISRQKARELKAANQLYFFNHGKDAKLLRPLSDERTAVEKFSGWNIMREMLNTALNRGRAGQFALGYEIPYAFEGTLHNWNNPSGNQVKGEKFRRVNMSAPSGHI